jgi:hypothetical protein
MRGERPATSQLCIIFHGIYHPPAGAAMAFTSLRFTQYFKAFQLASEAMLRHSSQEL